MWNEVRKEQLPLESAYFSSRGNEAGLEFAGYHTYSHTSDLKAQTRNRIGWTKPEIRKGWIHDHCTRCGYSAGDFVQLARVSFCGYSCSEKWVSHIIPYHLNLSRISCRKSLQSSAQIISCSSQPARACSVPWLCFARLNPTCKGPSIGRTLSLQRFSNIGSMRTVAWWRVSLVDDCSVPDLISWKPAFCCQGQVRWQWIF